MTLNREEMIRYRRQLTLRNWGEPRQELLKRARVLVVGAGGLGSPALLYLASAGVGRLGIADSDAVDLTNLQRQILFQTADCGRPKAEVARERLSALNPEIAIRAYPVRIDERSIEAVLPDYDLVIDATDGFDSRYAIHDACFRARKPYIYGAVDRFEGRIAVFFAGQGDSPCGRCLFPDSSSIVQSCAEAGVLGVLPGVIGTLQATEALKLLVNLGEPAIGKVLIYDALTLSFDSFELRKNPDCVLCGANPRTVTKPAPGITVPDLRAKLASGARLRLIDVRDRSEVATGAIVASENIPLAELPVRLEDLDRDVETILYCQRGIRSAAALELLRAAGVRQVQHLEGGYAAFAVTSREVRA